MSIGSVYIPKSQKQRLPAVDLLRGLVMVVMALDHTRDFFSGAPMWTLTDPQQTTPALYITRWVTHFCAPVFALLAGVGAGLSGERSTKAQLSRFLLVRGIWLIVLEFTIVRLGWFFSFDYHVLIAMVIWMLGWSMIVLSGLIFLPRWAIAIFGLCLIGGHNYFDDVKPAVFGSWSWLWIFLHADGAVNWGSNYVLAMPYKLIPWVGVMALGYAMTPVFHLESSRRRQLLAMTALMLIALFITLRIYNVYGDPHPWTKQPDATKTLMAFLNCEKYPPSLDYLLMTLGPALFALAIFDRPPGRLAKPIIVFGRVPLFFYLLHLPLIHGLAIAVDWAMTRSIHDWLLAPPQRAQAPEGYGYSLPVVYGAWLAVLILLYPLCRWFAGLKARDRTGWSSWL